jgi:hypothetical protein
MKKENYKFKVGNKVKCSNEITPEFGEIVFIFDESSVPYLVRFKGWVGGHDGQNGLGYICPEGAEEEHWCCNESDLELANEGLSFMEAVDAMKQGKKVKRKNWTRYYYLFMSSGTIYYTADKGRNYDEMIPSLDNIEAIDWEIVVDEDKD